MSEVIDTKEDIKLGGAQARTVSELATLLGFWLRERLEKTVVLRGMRMKMRTGVGQDFLTSLTAKSPASASEKKVN